MKLFGFFKEIGKGILAFLCGAIGIMGCYPIVPAFFAACSTSENASVFVVLGSVLGIVFFLPLGSMVKYLFVLVILSIATRLYRWMNRGCSVWESGILAALATLVMHFAEKSFQITGMNMGMWTV